jgi:hypothetical protein
MNELRISCSTEIGVMLDGAAVMSDMGLSEASPPARTRFYSPSEVAVSTPAVGEESSDVMTLRRDR